MNVRKAMLAGSWYPDTATGCEKDINNYLQDDKIKTVSKKKFIGGIVPHAGWYFSGSIACNVIKCLQEEKPPDVLVIFGMHLHPGSPCYIMKEGAWETPFGALQIEPELVAELTKRFHFVIETHKDFTQDNTIEVQLPFIKYFFEDVKIVPIGVPPVENSFEIGKAVVEIATSLGLEVKVIGSTDLTHYGFNYGFTPKGTGPAALNWVRHENDRKVIEAMLALEPVAVISEAQACQNACCAGAAATAIAAAKQLGAEKAELIAYATSYDKSPGNSFVGYTGIVFLKD
ncbi:MAG: AmmeMemoRadiSam system protein B [Deltaproteobacteria bacterium CG1_02_45_11]|nr:MAG: AmmeMemoRadiSam system protein B [Deltaproteobacteria bacterium CG1_02_45_11]